MRIKLTERDVKVLEALDSFGILSTAQLNSSLFSGVDYRTVLRRLRKLKRVKLIHRIKQYHGGMSIWYLTPKGAHRIGKTAHIKSVNRNALEHDTSVNEVRFSLERFGLGEKWISAHKTKNEKGPKPQDKYGDVIPISDWLCSFRTWDGMRRLAIEVELSYKGPDRTAHTLSAYARQRQVAHVWYIVATEALGRKISTIAAKYRKRFDESDVWFVWSILSDVLQQPEQAKIHGGKNIYLLKELFVLPAHRSAHPVGSRKMLALSVDQEKAKLLLDVTARNAS